jgi:uncharacterized protein (DUF1684 family)
VLDVMARVLGRRRGAAAVLGAIALLVAGCRPAPGDTGALPADYQAQVQAWRDKHEADYRRDFVTVSGLHFLDPGVYTIGSGPGNGVIIEAAVPEVIGTLKVENGFVQLRPAPGVAITQEGKPAAGPIVMKEPDRPAAPEVSIGDIRLVVHTTGDRLALRVRDPNGQPARDFGGFAWFPIDPAYRIVARFVRDAEPRSVPVANTLNGLDTYATEGVLEFTLQGQTLRLRPFTTRPNRFYIVFRDASSGAETYGVARFLYADLLADGTAVLDFNQAYNPPCAFNKFTTCPLPLKENILPVKVLAGERAYGVRGS